MRFPLPAARSRSFPAASYTESEYVATTSFGAPGSPRLETSGEANQPVWPWTLRTNTGAWTGPALAPAVHTGFVCPPVLLTRRGGSLEVQAARSAAAAMARACRMGRGSHARGARIQVGNAARPRARE